MSKLTVQDLRANVRQQFAQAESDLKHLVEVPSFAGSGRLDDSAALVAKLAKEVGFGGVQVVAAKGADGSLGGPAVIGHIAGPEGAPTVLLYAHHDVQPVQGDWLSAPFTATVRDGRLYGRGAADDGAGLVVHLAALRALGHQVPVNVTLLIEGEEESGSPTFAQLLKGQAKRVKADVAVVADCDNWTATIPGLTTQLRGVTDVTVTLRTASHGAHSGMFGGPVLDAPLALARLIATLHNDQGDVAVEGLVRTGTSGVDYPEDRLREGAGLLEGTQLAGTGPLADRLWNSPAIALIGFDAPRTDQVSNTLVEVAKAVISLRVPPGLDVDQAQAALHHHLVEHAPFGAQVQVEDGVSGPPYLADVEASAAKAVAWALTEAFGQPVVYTGQGGSIPLAQQLKDAFPDIEVLLTGVEDPNSNAHAANESVDLAMLEKAILAEALFLAKLGGVLN